ncbi:hypothetical protein K501DRAFT_189586 [Backusella circina FSU 941]|nr:hypothetical protein K501DRAFT_189586 [Backusella circina FSU 941]
MSEELSSSFYPNSYFYYGSLDQTSGLLSRSPGSYYLYDNYSEEYDVILDDGTRQKRSVSLSTMPFGRSVTNEDDGLKKKKFKANYNHFYYDDEEESTNPTNTKNHIDEFYQQMEQHNLGLIASNPDSIIKDLQPASDEDESTSLVSKSSHTPFVKRQFNRLKSCWSRLTPTYQQKMVLKCSFAFFIGSLFTFIPFLNNMLGSARLSSHVIATVTVFFSPSKAVGGIIEAAGYGLMYTVCAMLVSLASMWVAIYLRAQDYYITSCLVTLGFWLAGSTFVLSFIKAHYNKPAIGTGCGLGFMIIFPVLVREGSIVPAEFDPTYIEEMFAIVTIGTGISVATCCFIWPMTATKKLKSDIDDTLTAIRVLLKLLTKTFLLDADLPEFTANEGLEKAINSHRTSFTSLQSSLHDAKREYFNLDIWQHADGYDTIVSSLQRLAQHIGGLRSSCGLQFEVLKTTDKKKKPDYGTMPGNSTAPKSSKKKRYHIKPDEQRKKMEYELKQEISVSSLDAPSFIRRNSKVDNTIPEEVEDDENGDGALVQFIQTVRPPMKSLAYTCKQTLIHLQSRFTGQITPSTPSFGLLRQNLAMAMSVFEESQQLALTRMYRRKMLNQSKSGQHLHPKELHSHLMNQFPAENVFLVYFFVFCLLEFAKELMVLVECVQSVYGPEESRNKKGFFNWLRRTILSNFWWLCCCFYSRQHTQTQKTMSSRPLVDSFKPNNNNTFNTLHTPKPKTKTRKIFLSLWGFFSWFKTHTVRYALKATLISVALAAPAFIPSTTEIFQSWKMDWVLITVTAVMTPTVGGTNIVALLRVMATILGSIVAVLFYQFIPHNGNLLLIFSSLFSIPCFWMILNHKHGRFGFFSLLSFNLIVPYMYNHRSEPEQIDLFELAFMRCAAVSAAVLIGLFVTVYIWPFEARKEMRKGMSDLLIQFSWLYKQLVSEYSESTPAEDNTSYSQLVKKAIEQSNRAITSAEELNALAKRNEERALQFQQVELQLQVNIVELQGLLVHAPNEPRLKGAFPVKTYETMLTSCQNILDKFLSIRIVILKDVWATQVRRDLMLPASQELMEMAGSVLLYFYLLASALQLKTPLPPYLPPAEKAREQLMAKLQQLPTMAHVKKVSSMNINEEWIVNDECYMVYYAYVIMMESIIIELEQLGKQMKELFGSLVPDEQWARCFGLIDLENSRK